MIRVLVADDHRLVVESLQKVLDGQRDLKCVGVAGDGVEAVQMVKDLRPDVAIIDINMPRMDGIEATRRIKAEFPEIAVLMLTAYDCQEYAIACLHAGADGFVLKANLPCEGLVNAVRTVHTGRAVFDHDAVASLRKLTGSKDRTTISAKCDLCDREKEVLQLAATGMTSKEIANALDISGLTVNAHFGNIFKKLAVESRMEAVMLALRKGWISQGDPKNRNSDAN